MAAPVLRKLLLDTSLRILTLRGTSVSALSAPLSSHLDGNCPANRTAILNQDSFENEKSYLTQPFHIYPVFPFHTYPIFHAGYPSQCPIEDEAVDEATHVEEQIIWADSVKKKRKMKMNKHKYRKLRKRLRRRT